jgi:hypothetical protein
MPAIPPFTPTHFLDDILRFEIPRVSVARRGHAMKTRVFVCRKTSKCYLVNDFVIFVVLQLFLDPYMRFKSLLMIPYVLLLFSDIAR